MTSRTDVIVVAYRSGETLSRSLDSVVGSAASLLVIDNDPNDGATEQIAREFEAVHIPMPSNVGFACAVNRGLNETGSDYVLLLNPDAVVSPDFVARLAGHLDRDPSIASVGGRILRGEPGSTTIDSLGISIEPGRRPVDLAHGIADDGRHTGVTEVFGVTAAAALYRRSALERVRVQGQVLPEDFFMYMDDVDLAWRLRLAGYRSVVDHGAIAWHRRDQAGGTSDPAGGLIGWLRKAHHEVGRPDYVRVLSSCNLLLTIVRNDDAGRLLRQWPRFAMRRLPADAWMAVQRPAALLESRGRVFELLPAALAARREIQANRTVDAEEMARWLP